MPEDVHPNLPRSSSELAHYFTLGMALNYQRNSYALWRSCTATWEDVDRKWVYEPSCVVRRSVEELREALVHHKVALQPNNHIRIWRTICEGLVRHYDGDIRNLITKTEGRISILKEEIAVNKKAFPYLSGTKICNYWLYVMLTYTDFGLREKWALNVAPDTHVINATRVLGLISKIEAEHPSARELVATRWRDTLQNTELDPIDIHTPLWLWSRSGFINIQG